MSELIKKRLEESSKVKIDMINDNKIIKVIEEIANIIIDCYKKGNKVVIFGNGGSAADAQHIAAELVGKFKLERKALCAIALNTNTSIITAIANDYEFGKIFERQIEGIVNKGDVVIGISTSGNSENVIKGLLKAKEKDAIAIAFTGKSGGKIKNIANIVLQVPSDDTPRIQEAHITAGHIICEIVEKELAKE